MESRTTPGDRIFIWGSRTAELYILSNRMPATHYIDYDVWANVPRDAAGPQRCSETVRLLRRTRPRYIIEMARGKILSSRVVSPPLTPGFPAFPPMGSDTRL
jgi:hypothetical protein